MKHDRLHDYGLSIVFVAIAVATVRVLYHSIAELLERWQ
jgi:hypothetical protein